MKKLCDLNKKDIEEKFEKIVKLISKPQFICKKCARVSKKKEYLCSPKELK